MIPFVLGFVLGLPAFAVVARLRVPMADADARRQPVNEEPWLYLNTSRLALLETRRRRER